MFQNFLSKLVAVTPGTFFGRLTWPEMVTWPDATLGQTYHQMSAIDGRSGMPSFALPSFFPIEEKIGAEIVAFWLSKSNEWSLSIPHLRPS